jgi:GMP synthase-like glutamine amidotransferase
MRCIQDILNETDCKFPDIPVDYTIFDARYKNQMPDNSFDIYISSGGPGSPFEGEGTKWEKDYFKLMDELWDYNQSNNENKKHIFFICHSFQIMARYFKFGEVTKRHSKSFGVMPVHKTDAGERELILEGLPDPFFAADFREYQVIQPDSTRLDELGAEIICLEKIRPHVDYERAVMGVRISNEIVGTQFHPEADPASMFYHFRQPERKEHVIGKYGEDKYNEMLELLERPDSIPLTRNTVIPNFLKNAVQSLRIGTKLPQE